MIYIKNDTTSQQTVTITNHFDYFPTKLRLRLTNKLDGTVTEFEIVNFTMSRPFVNLIFKMPDTLTDGEYNYNLIDPNKGVIAFGMAVVGEYTRDTQSYITDNKKIQYKG